MALHQVDGGNGDRAGRDGDVLGQDLVLCGQKKKSRWPTFSSFLIRNFKFSCCINEGKKGVLVFLTFSSLLPAETLDEGEDQEDDQRGHADPPERVGGT